jgi:hypothetical protein
MPARRASDRAGAVRRFVPRPPPPCYGEKLIPQGDAACLAGMKFVVTGVLDSLERVEQTPPAPSRRFSPLPLAPAVPLPPPPPAPLVLTRHAASFTPY